MQSMPQLQSQNTRRRGPKLSIPVDADVASVRYYKCPPKELLAVKDSAPPPVPKVHLKFIPRCLRRPSQWTPLLNEWLTSCEEAKHKAEVEATSSSTTTEDQEDFSCNSSTSGACSGGTATTDFSSVSSPRAAPEHRIDHHTVPQDHLLYLHSQRQHQVPEHSYRINHHVMPQQSNLQYASHPHHYPFRVPPAQSPAAQLTPAQWAELAHLQAASIRSANAHPPPKLMNVHTAYLPELDAAVRAMMQQQPASASAPHARQMPPTQPHHHRSVPSPSLPWQQYAGFYSNSSSQGSLKSSVPASNCSTRSDRSSSVRSSDSKDGSQICSFCYQYAVHEAHNKNTRLPHEAERGYWRGHVLREEEGGSIICPRLLRRVCSLCGATGQSAHQTNYCPATKRMTSCY